MSSGRNNKPESMDNASLAKVFEEIARLLEAEGDSPFKIRAYRNAAYAISVYPEELRDLVARGDDLRIIPGIGDAIAGKLHELLATGGLEFLRRLRGTVPAGVLALLQVPEIGPKVAVRLVKELGISSVEELDAELKSGRVALLPGFDKRKNDALRRAVDEFQRKEPGSTG